MKARDLTYAGETLSSHGFMIGGFDNVPAGDDVTTDSQRNFNMVSMFQGAYQPFVYASYEDHLTMEFSVMKYPLSKINDAISQDHFEISQQEIRQMKRWLSRPIPHKLSFIDSEFDGYYWEGSFNVSEVYLNGAPYALKLTFESNRPFAIQSEKKFKGTLAANESFSIHDVSDEIGFIYPKLIVTCLESGLLRLTNSYDDRITIVNNCSADEIITFTPLLQIESNLDTHSVYEDFNYQFLRIGNTYETRKNVITSSLPISYVLTYEPVAKVVIA